MLLGSLTGNDRLQQRCADGVDTVVDDVDGHEGQLTLDQQCRTDQGGGDQHDGQIGLVDVGLLLQIHADGGVEQHGQTCNDDLDGAVILGAEVELILDEVVEALLIGVVADTRNGDDDKDQGQCRRHKLLGSQEGAEGVGSLEGQRLCGLDLEGGDVDIIFSHEEIEGDKNGWNIRLLQKQEDGTYLEIMKKISKWNSSGYNLSNFGLAEGEYYIVIDGDSLAYNSTSYTCQWNFTARTDFEIEPNGSMETAKDIQANTYYYGAIISSDVDFDEDYYRFEVDKERNVSLELWHEKVTDSSVTWVASIIDENGNVVKSVDSSLNQGLVSTGVVTLKEGTYYIKIETGMYGSESPYYFKLVR